MPWLVKRIFSWNAPPSFAKPKLIAIFNLKKLVILYFSINILVLCKP